MTDTYQGPEAETGDRYIIVARRTVTSPDYIDIIRFLNHESVPYWEWLSKPKVEGLEFDTYLENVIREVLPEGDHISDAETNAATNAPTDLNPLTTLLGALTGEVNATNTKQNDLAAKYNDLATKYNTLLDRLEAQGLLNAS